MQARKRVAYATATCAGVSAALTGAASCVSSSNPVSPEIDGSLPDVSVPQPDTSTPPNDTSAPPGDAGPDAVVLDSATFDAGDAADATDAADANPGCVPGSIVGFSVPPYVHANPQAFPCNTDTQAEQMAATCLDASAYAACASYPTTGDDESTPVACGACFVTPEAVPDGGDAAAYEYGAAVLGAVAIPNVAGCIELADPSDAGLSAATAIQAAWRCAEFSCTQNCPVSDEASRAAYAACLQQAATGPCVTFAQAASAALAVEADAGGNEVTQFCLPLSEDAGGAVGQLTDIARFFCLS